MLAALATSTAPAAPEPSLVVTVSQAARLLGVREAAVRSLIHSGQLPAARFDSWKWKIKRADLEVFVDRALAAADLTPRPRAVGDRARGGRPRKRVRHSSSVRGSAAGGGHA